MLNYLHAKYSNIEERELKEAQAKKLDEAR